MLCVFEFVVIDDGSLTDDMLYEIINNLTKSEEEMSSDSTSSKGKDTLGPSGLQIPKCSHISSIPTFCHP